MYKVLDQSEGNVLGLEISGKIDITQERELIAKAEAILKDHDKIRLLVVVDKGLSATFEAAKTDMAWVIKNVKKLGKLAIVADNAFLGHLVEIDAKFASMLDIGEKHFTTDEVDEAWAWIKA
ncbi:hypothetical protein RA27_16165 [Ruegeria sp. ANG-R]|uniref:STAS/SEC14 domain-containing protein n=1 Tax=Ruegeria sp. ANG-R TaxID=1577903 RepID=UPI00057E0791|nr:STAS/SEC14 domain-containing protein [Ruegeria sp. ANG-R]KIC40333.1 hypothetical protein RA27_16165 [Ruegeria sp. ANG-R]